MTAEGYSKFFFAMIVEIGPQKMGMGRQLQQHSIHWHQEKHQVFKAEKAQYRQSLEPQFEVKP